MVSLPTSKCVNTSSAFQDQYIELEKAITHSHGPDAEHAHGGLAFTTWLDFSLAARQAEAIEDAFIKLMPEGKYDFEANYIALEKDLVALDESMKAIAEKIISSQDTKKAAKISPSSKPSPRHANCTTSIHTTTSKM